MKEIVQIVRGSHIYGTASENSDMDILIIYPNDYIDDIQPEEDGYVHQILRAPIGPELDTIQMHFWQFKKLVKDYDIMALEALWSNHEFDKNKELINKYKYDKIDLWKLRQSISAVTNNSWAKCHKKLTVEKDYDLYCGQKSLFHVLRIYLYGIQIAKYGKIVDFKCENETYGPYKNLKEIYDEIMNLEDKTWESYKIKYQSYRNLLATEFKKYCPKEV